MCVEHLSKQELVLTGPNAEPFQEEALQRLAAEAENPSGG